MPLVTIWVLKGQFDADQKADLIIRVTDGIVATAGESSRALTWVLIEEIDRGGWGAGGRVRSLDHDDGGTPSEERGDC